MREVIRSLSPSSPAQTHQKQPTRSNTRGEGPVQLKAVPGVLDSQSAPLLPLAVRSPTCRVSPIRGEARCIAAAAASSWCKHQVARIAGRGSRPWVPPASLGKPRRWHTHPQAAHLRNLGTPLATATGRSRERRVGVGVGGERRVGVGPGGGGRGGARPGAEPALQVRGTDSTPGAELDRRRTSTNGAGLRPGGWRTGSAGTSPLAGAGAPPLRTTACLVWHCHWPGGGVLGGDRWLAVTTVGTGRGWAGGGSRWGGGIRLGVLWAQVLGSGSRVHPLQEHRLQVQGSVSEARGGGGTTSGVQLERGWGGTAAGQPVADPAEQLGAPTSTRQRQPPPPPHPPSHTDTHTDTHRCAAKGMRTRPSAATFTLRTCPG